MDNDRGRFQSEALKFMFELEVLNNPQVINNLKMTVFMASKSIKEVELLIYREKKAMLVFVELSWWGRRFGKKRLFRDVQDNLAVLLPSFRFRVTDDPKILQLAIDRVKQALTGGKNETLNSSGGNSNPAGVAQQDAADATANPPGNASDNAANPTEQSKTELPSEKTPGPDDSKQEQKT